MSESKITRCIEYKVFDIETAQVHWMKIDQNLWTGSNSWVLNNPGLIDRSASNLLEKPTIVSFFKDLELANILLLDSKTCVWWERKVVGYIIRADKELSEDLIVSMTNSEVIRDPFEKEMDPLLVKYLIEKGYMKHG